MKPILADLRAARVAFLHAWEWGYDTTEHLERINRIRRKLAAKGAA